MVGLANGGEHGGKASLDGSRSEPSNKRPTLAEAGIDRKAITGARNAFIICHGSSFMVAPGSMMPRVRGGFVLRMRLCRLVGGGLYGDG